LHNDGKTPHKMSINDSQALLCWIVSLPIVKFNKLLLNLSLFLFDCFSFGAIFCKFLTNCISVYFISKKILEFTGAIREDFDVLTELLAELFIFCHAFNILNIINRGAPSANTSIRSMKLVCVIMVSLIKGLLFDLLLGQPMTKRFFDAAFNVIICIIYQVFIVNILLQARSSARDTARPCWTFLFSHIQKSFSGSYVLKMLLVI
jgi:hypothetical protein